MDDKIREALSSCLNYFENAETDDYEQVLMVELREALAALDAPPRWEPAGYHYIYDDPHGSGREVIRHEAETWNGMKPKRAIPYYYAEQPREAEGWLELVHHLRHCVECADNDVMSCREGRSLWEAVMPPKPGVEGE